MQTLWLKANEIEVAARLLREGQLVAFPTETVYGLGASAWSEKAVAGIFLAKGRPQDNPLIVHIAEKEQVMELAAAIPPEAERLMERFWPGPLTLLFPRRPQVPELVCAGLETVAVRQPAHPLALELIRQAGVPLAAPSANLSGRPSPTLAEHVWEDLAGRIAAVLDGGPVGVGVESTVLDLLGPEPMILRPGGVTREELEEALGRRVALDPALLGQTDRPRSPGMKYRHYAPAAPLLLLDGPEREEVWRRIAAEAAADTGILISEEGAAYLAGRCAGQMLVLAPLNRPDLAAQRLYSALRTMDQAGVKRILAEAWPRHGLGLALMNRMEKAAGGNYLRVEVAKHE